MKKFRSLNLSLVYRYCVYINLLHMVTTYLPTMQEISAAQRCLSSGDRWNLTSVLTQKFFEDFHKNDVLFLDMSIAMKNCTWSPRVGLRILMGIALGCIQVSLNPSTCNKKPVHIFKLDQSWKYVFDLSGHICCEHIKTNSPEWTRGRWIN